MFNNIINNKTIINYFIIYQKKSISSTKSTYNEFYKSIGNPKYISAPMVDSSELAWRILVRKHGVDLAFSQMMHGRNFLVDPLNYRNDCIDWNDYRTTNNDIKLEKQGKKLDNPLIVQLASDDPDILTKVGNILETNQQVKAIDLNLGCPQKIAKRGNYGAYLLPNKNLIINLLSNMVKNINCNITAKIRRLPSDKDTIDLCKAIEDCGVSMLTIHGRTVESSKLFTGTVDWNIINKIKSNLTIPIIANGGISNRRDVLKCLEITGCDGVMSSEALLENPKLFSEEGDYLFHNDFINAQLNTVLEYMEIVSHT
jgi:tRNA-dihydrouridine synthase 1